MEQNKRAEKYKRGEKKTENSQNITNGGYTI